MKMKIRRLAIAAMLLTGSSTTLANDGTSMVGDLPGFGEEAYFGEDAAYTEVPANTESQNDASAYVGEGSFEEDLHVSDEEMSDAVVSDDGEVQPVAHTQQAMQRAAGRSLMRQASMRTNQQTQSNYAPVSNRQMQPVSHQMTMGSGYVESSHGDCGCGDSSCGGSSCGAEVSCGCGDMGCDGGSKCESHRKICSVMDRCQGNTWAQMDLLLWFAQSRDTPPLIVESDAGTLPVLDPTVSPTARSVFGDEIETELTVGVRADAGIWLTDNVGIGGRFWGLSESESNYAFSGNGDQRSIGRAFFNTNGSLFAGDNGGEDSLPIALTGVPGGPDLSGSIVAESTLDIWAAEAYGRLRFGCAGGCQLDFIGGYSHFDIDDSLFIGSTTTIEGTGAAPPPGSAVGDSVAYTDRFDTENTFDGGQLGFDLTMNRGRWMARSLTKVHLGNMNQNVRIQGRSVTTPNGGTGTEGLGGILAGNQDVDFERDVFAFAPEANFKLGYRFRPNVLLSVGYSFVYFDNVALTGDTIDRLVDGATLGQGTNDNGFLIDDSSLFVHGIDLGFVIDF